MKNKGITLIALVITIVIMIILTGITISLVFNSGFMGSITNGVDNYKQAQNKENNVLNDIDDFLNKISGNIEIVTVTKAVKGLSKLDFSNAEDFSGNIIKITPDDLSNLGIDSNSNYYVNCYTGEVYDISGKTLNGITYHTLQEYIQISNSSSLDTTKELLNVKQSKINYIKDCQFNSGAIALQGKMGYTISKTVPYFNCIALRGLLNDLPSIPNVKKYIQWHFNHINNTPYNSNDVTGSIYDYYIHPNEDEEFNENALFDSVDSYSSLFFILLKEYYEKTGDSQIFIDNKDKLILAESALNSMFNNGTTSNLTLTMPAYPVYYLMDNTESYAGYEALAYIYKEIYNEPAKETLYNERKELIKTSIETNLWNQNFGDSSFFHYKFALNETDSSYTGLLFNKTYYPFVIGQLYPILNGLISPTSERANHLYFLHNYHSEIQPVMPPTYPWFNFEHNNTDFPHMESLIVALMFNTDNNDRNYQINLAISNLIYNANPASSSYIWNVAETGYAITAINMYLDKF